MTIKYIDKNGSQSVANIPDDATYKVEKNSDETFHVYADIPHARLKELSPHTRLAETLDKTTADKCIEEIYNQLMEKKEYCDLVPIQLGKSSDRSNKEEDNNV